MCIRDRLGAARIVVRDELKNTLEVLASFCRDVILIKEKAESGFLLNPDFEGDLEELARSITLDQALDSLAEIDLAIASLQRNLNVNILVNSIFSNFLEWNHV